jgi:predicted RNase H-like nuclease (RuvC/YqgF family)
MTEKAQRDEELLKRELTIGHQESRINDLQIELKHHERKINSLQKELEKKFHPPFNLNDVMNHNIAPPSDETEQITAKDLEKVCDIH